MFFLIQKRGAENVMQTECFMLEYIIDHSHRQHEFLHVSIDDFYFDGKFGTPDNFPKYWATAIPVGTLEFVRSWMEVFHNHGLNPVEIPICLRTQEFLKREYKFVKAGDIPKTGKWFIKDVSELKSFSTASYDTIEQSYSYFGKDENGLIQGMDNAHIFQVSERLNVLSEYRCYFIDGYLENVCHYNGDMKHYIDLDLVEKANVVYSVQPDYPKSYSMDVMETDKGTALVEIHPFTSLGLYSTLWSDKITYAYRDGIDYYINHNTKITL